MPAKLCYRPWWHLQQQQRTPKAWRAQQTRCWTTSGASCWRTWWQQAVAAAPAAPQAAQQQHLPPQQLPRPLAPGMTTGIRAGSGHSECKQAHGQTSQPRIMGWMASSRSSNCLLCYLSEVSAQLTLYIFRLACSRAPSQMGSLTTSPRSSVAGSVAAAAAGPAGRAAAPRSRSASGCRLGACRRRRCLAVCRRPGSLAGAACALPSAYLLPYPKGKA